MGHAFFTLAIGAGAMMVYGAYLPTQTRLGESVIIIAILDVLVAVFAGLAIFPIIFTYHLPPQGGPGLMFQILPIAFGHMEGGQFWGALFFFLLLFAAWTSSLSLAEPLVILLMERLKMKRIQASILVGGIAWTLGIVSLLSFNVWQDVQLFGHWNFFTAITDLATNIMLPIGGLCFSLFVGWKMGPTLKELGTNHRFLFKIWLLLVRYIAPLGILTILISAFF